MLGEGGYIGMGFKHGLTNIRIRNNIVSAKHAPRFVTTNFHHHIGVHFTIPLDDNDPAEIYFGDIVLKQAA